MKVTNAMISRWARAGLQIAFGIVLLIYGQGVVQEFGDLFERAGPVLQMDSYVMLMSAIMWIITLWCFVSAALHLLASFREQRITIDDVGAKIDALEQKLIGANAAKSPDAVQSRPMVVQQAEVKMTEPEVDMPPEETPSEEIIPPEEIPPEEEPPPPP